MKKLILPLSIFFCNHYFVAAQVTNGKAYTPGNAMKERNEERKLEDERNKAKNKPVKTYNNNTSNSQNTPPATLEPETKLLNYRYYRLPDDVQSYEGDKYNNSVPNGTGTMLYKDGREYTGQWDYGQKSGQGEMRFPDGMIEKGMWKDDKFESGALILKDRRIMLYSYEKLDGPGGIAFKNGDSFNGYIIHLEPYSGIYTYKNGKKYEGEYISGRPHGKGKMTYPNGNIYEGNFSDSMVNGFVRVTDASGKLIKAGMWKNNKFLYAMQDTSGSHEKLIAEKLFEEKTRPHKVKVFQSGDWKNVGICEDFMIALKSDGTLWSCGYINHFISDIDTTVNQNLFVQIGNSSNWKTFGCMDENVMAIQKDGTLWSWRGNNKRSKSPTQVGNSTNWADISCAVDYAILLTKEGTLWAVGSNSSGALGLGEHANGTNEYNQADVPLKIGNDTNWKKILSTNSSVFVLKNDGTIWGWGSNHDGELGLVNPKIQWTPVQLASGSDRWKYISSGSHYTMLIKEDGTLWASGENLGGQLGINNLSSTHAFMQVGLDNDWVQVASGWDYTLAIKKDGSLWTAGDINHGKEGLVKVSDDNLFFRMGKDRDWKMAIINLHYKSIRFVVMKNNGSFWTWNANVDWLK